MINNVNNENGKPPKIICSLAKPHLDLNQTSRLHCTEKVLEGHKPPSRPGLLFCRDGPWGWTSLEGDPSAPKLGPHLASSHGPGERDTTGFRGYGLWWPHGRVSGRLLWGAVPASGTPCSLPHFTFVNCDVNSANTDGELLRALGRGK